MSEPIAPTVSVIAMGYQQRSFVSEALDSIAAQTLSDFELIVTDDASSDGTREVIEEWLRDTGRDATFIAHQTNRGLIPTYMEALSNATGTLIAGIGLDDVWLPDRLRQHADAFSASGPEVAVVYSDVVPIDASGAPLADSFMGEWVQSRGLAEPPSGDLFLYLASGNFVPACGATYRRAAIEAVGGYDRTLAYEDWDILLRLAERFELQYSAPLVGKYRRHSGSIVHNWSVADEESTARLLLKHAGKRVDVDAALLPMLERSVERLYEEGHPRAAHYLRRRATLRRSANAYVLAACATLHIPRTAVESVRRRVHSWLSSRPGR